MKTVHPADAVLMPCPPGFPNCEPLPVVQHAGEFISFWQPEPGELDHLNRGGSIKLSFPGYQPVLRVEVTSYPEILTNWARDVQFHKAGEMFAETYHNPYEAAAALDGFKVGARWEMCQPFEDAEVEAGLKAVVKHNCEAMGVEFVEAEYAEAAKKDPTIATIRDIILVALLAVGEERMK